MGKKRKAAKRPKTQDPVEDHTEQEEEVPLTRFEKDDGDDEEGSSKSDTDSENEERVPKKKKQKREGKWTNKQRVLIFGSRGIGYRDRHLLEDLRALMPHSKSDSKFQRKESLFVINEMAEMKNCNKCLLFEGRKNRKDLYLWAANIARGPSAKFLVENVHTMAELKMTGNCLRSSRPLLSFDQAFDKLAHLKLLKELFTQIFSVPNHHPKSQPFFDHVFTFAVVDDKIWFRNFQIIEEDGSLAEIGPRFVLNPIKVFDSSFSGQTLWSNDKYVTPTAHRSIMKKMKAGKYRKNIQSKAAYLANRPEGPTVEVDEAEDVFQVPRQDDNEEQEMYRLPVKPRKNKKKKAKKTSKESAMTAELMD